MFVPYLRNADVQHRKTGSLPTEQYAVLDKVIAPIVSTVQESYDDYETAVDNTTDEYTAEVEDLKESTKTKTAEYSAIVGFALAVRPELEHPHPHHGSTAFRNGRTHRKTTSRSCAARRLTSGS